MFRNVLLLLFGQVCTASSVIAIKASKLDAGYLAASRVFFAALLLLPLFLKELRADQEFAKLRASGSPAGRYFAVFRFFSPSLLPGLFLGLHFNTWNLGARATLSANATLIVNLIPLVMPLLVLLVFREKPKKHEIAGTVLGLAGLVLLTLESLGLDGANLYGDFICFVSMLLFAAYLIFARTNKSRGLWIYLFPLYLVSGLCSFAVNLFFSSPFDQPWSWNEVSLILFLAVFPTLVGHNTMNWAMRRFPSQMVSLLTVTQFIWAGLIAYFLFGEIPGLNFYPAALLVLAACAVVLLFGHKKEKGEEKAPAVETQGKNP